MDATDLAYIDLDDNCARIDRRDTERYRFDLERDIAWDAAGAPGRYFNDALLVRLGVDPEALRADREAHDLFQWALALATCEGFHELERLILRFVAGEKAALGPSKSVAWLEEEEEKHVRLFRRYADGLRAERPAEAARFDRLFAPSAAVLGRLDERAAFPSAAAHHYIFWLHTIFFEEYTVFLADVLEEAPEGLQPAWLSAHRAHRREEAQHVVTDATHLAAVNLPAEERRRLSKAFFFRVEEEHPRFFGVEAAERLAREVRPGAPGFVRERRFDRLPLRDDVLFGAGFRRARDAAPYLREAAEEALGAGAATAEALRRLRAPRALIAGPALRAPPPGDRTLAQMLGRAANERAGAAIVYVREDGSERAESYEELLARAETFLAGYRRRGLAAGSKVILLLSRPEDFAPAFWGALAGGIVPVPLGIPATVDRLDEDVRRLARIDALLGGPPVVADPLLKSFLDRTGAAPALRGAAVLTPEEIEAEGGRDSRWARVRQEDPALIQFSSGSTGHPRGVVLTHRNVLFDLQATIERHEVRADDVFVSWLPLYHDMGLLGYHVTPVVAGAKQVLLGPLHFVKRPLVWLEALARHRGTISASPNFGFSRALRELERAPERARDLDLRAVRCILDGAEPISARVLRGFTAALAPAGLRPEAICPAYGLAEATVAVAMGLPGERPRVHHFDRTTLDSPDGPERVEAGDPDAVALVDEGPPVPGVEVRVVDDRGETLPEGVLGRIEVRGPNVSPGYFGDEEPAARAAGEGGRLRTGDLGLVIGGRLVVAGREKDVIFVNGRNFHAHDLEERALEVEGVSPGRVAVVGSTDPAGGGERVLVFVHPKPTPLIDEIDVLERLRRHLNEAVGFPVDHVIPLHPEEFPKTSSGKLERWKLRARFERGEFDAAIARVEALLGGRGAPAAEWRAVDGRGGERRAGAERRRRPRPTPDRRQARAPALAADIRGIWAEVLGLAPGQVGLDDTFRALGGDSLQATDLHGRLERRVGRALDRRILVECRTVREMAEFLERTAATPSPAPEPAPAVAPAPAAAAARTGREIAVIGMACRLPGAADPEALWEMLRAGRSAFREMPPGRRPAGLDDPDLPGYRVGGFLDLDQVRGFEPEAFGLSEREAADMDPQQRLFLETAADALLPHLDGRAARRAGVFAGAGMNQYFQGYGGDAGAVTAFSATGNLANMVAARVAQVLELTGPALTVNTACSSSLVAVHLACRSLLAGECDLAVAGGVELHLSAAPFLLFGRAGVLSRDGRCRPFDRDATGFLLGEGAAAVVLKPLARALEDGDRIRGVILGSAVNNDGGGLSGMAPNPAGQMAVLRAALAAAAIDPATVGYVEAHAAGTPIGDAVEARALARVFGESTARTGFCGLGSVKSNLGHLFSAAGIASLLKVLLALERREIPPTLGCERPEGLDLERTAFYPARRLAPFAPAAPGAPRRAGVSAFGIGGTNCHVVVEEAPLPDTELAPALAPGDASARRPAREVELLCLSGRDGPGLERLAARWAEHLRRAPDVPPAELCASANAVAARFPCRLALPVRSTAGAAAALAAARAPAPRAEGRPRIVFVFPGPGSHHAGMGRHLYESEPVFRATIRACGAEALIYGDGGEVDRIDRSQQAVFAFGLALARWLASLGIEPDALVGHSAGEYAAAALAGVFTLEEAAALVARRGAAMARTEPGKMAAVFASEERVRRAMAGLEGEVDIAAANAPGQVVVSGRAAAVERVVAALAADGVAARELNISCAAHSPLMEPAQAEFARALEAVEPRPPRIPIFSTVSGERLEAAPRAYWVRHLRAPVRFAAAIEAARRAGHGVFIELGASASLSQCIAETLGEGPLVVPLVRRSVEGWEGTMAALGRLFEAGAPLDLAALEGRPRRPRIAIPTYPYERRPFWKAAPAAAPWPALPADGEPAIRDHRVMGRPTAPAAWLLDRALAASGASRLRDVLIGRPLPLEAAGRVEVRVRGGRVTVETDAEHLSAAIDGAAADPGAPLDVDAVRARCPEEVSPARLYERLAASGLTYGPALRTLAGLGLGLGEALARLEPARADGGADRPRALDPAIVDGAMQALGAFTLGLPAEPGATFLGFAIDEVHALAPVRGPCVAHLVLRSALEPGAESIRADVTIAGPEGRVLARLRGVALKRFRGAPAARLYAVEWTAAAPLPEPGPGAVVLVDPPLETLFLAAKGLLETRPGGPRELRVVASDPAAHGFLRSLAAEEPGLRCEAAIRAPDGGRRLPALGPVAPPPGPAPLRERGVYWISGGLGGIGLEVAAALARECRARLLLSGRRPAAPREAIERLAALGAEVLYVQADAADRAAVRAALAAALDRFGALHGAVHAAGILEPGLVRDRPLERFRAVLAPKIDGARALAEATAGRDLDWLVFFSSIAGLFGGAGQADYAAANAWLSGFARTLAGERAGRTRVLAIDWGPWREVGMVAGSAALERLAAEGLLPLGPREGAQAFLDALRLPGPEVAIVALDPAREGAFLGALAAPAAAPVAPPPAPDSVAPAGPRPPLRTFVLGAVATGLRRRPEEIDPRVPFPSLGLDSLMAVEVVRKIEARYSVRLHPTLLFEFRTAADLIAHLEAEIGGTPAAAPAPVPTALAPAAPSAGDVEAWLVDGTGLALARVPLRAPGPGEVEVDVRAAGVNFIDLLAAAGMHPAIAERRFVPGHEVAGVVTRAGPDVAGLAIGDHVVALLPSGGYARRAIAPAAATIPLPRGLSFEEGAAVLISGLTAVACLEHYARLEPGERVLIQAAAGATGTALVQLARRIGAEIFGTAGSPGKIERLRALGVHHPIAYRERDFADEVRRLTGGEGVDVIVDSLSGEAIARGLEVLRPGGRFVEIGAAGVVAPPAVDPRALFAKNQSFLAVNAGALQRSPALFRRLLERLRALVEEGALRPVIDARVPFAAAPAAHERLRARKNIGKIVLVLDG